LAELDNKDKPMVLVFNKIDAYQVEEGEEKPTLEELKRTWMSKLDVKKCVYISANDKTNI
jgi:GTP-binding protein HflX